MSKHKDEFDDILHLENTLLIKGKKEGVSVGKRIGFEDGYIAGFQKGCEIGKEVGFYYGSTILWDLLIEKYPSLFSERSKKTVAKLRELIKSHTLAITNGKLLEQLDEIRSTYKLASSQIKFLYKKEETLNF